MVYIFEIKESRVKFQWFGYEDILRGILGSFLVTTLPLPVCLYEYVLTTRPIAKFFILECVSRNSACELDPQSQSSGLELPVVVLV